MKYKKIKLGNELNGMYSCKQRTKIGIQMGSFLFEFTHLSIPNIQ